MKEFLVAAIDPRCLLVVSVVSVTSNLVTALGLYYSFNRLLKNTFPVSKH